MNLRQSYATWQEATRQIAIAFNNAIRGDRVAIGTDTKDDLIIDLTTKGLVLKSPDNHYWRVTVSNAGALITTDAGTVKP